MGRKIPILLSTLTLFGGSLIGRAPTFADEASSIATDSSSATESYWTLEEVIRLHQRYQKIIEDTCRGDSACSWRYHEENFETNPDYRASTFFDSQRLIITSVTPSADTFTLYQGPLSDDSASMFGESPSGLSELYLAWLDPGVPGPFEDMSWLSHGHPYYIDDFSAEEPTAGVHLVLHDGSDDWATWFAPGTEKVFSAPDSELSSNSLETIQFTSFFGRRDMIGEMKYSGCLAALAESGEATCSVVFNYDGERTFVPASVVNAINLALPAEEETPAAEPDPVPSTEPSEDTPSAEPSEPTPSASDETPSDMSSTTDEVTPAPDELGAEPLTFAHNVTSSIVSSQPTTSSHVAEVNNGGTKTITTAVEPKSAIAKGNDVDSIPLASEETSSLPLVGTIAATTAAGGVAGVAWWGVKKRRK